MKKIILFSAPLPQILDRLLLEIFPEQIENKIFAYMPSDGSDEISNEKCQGPHFSDTVSMIV